MKCEQRWKANESGSSSRECLEVIAVKVHQIYAMAASCNSQDRCCKEEGRNNTVGEQVPSSPLAEQTRRPKSPVVIPSNAV